MPIWEWFLIAAIVVIVIVVIAVATTLALSRRRTERLRQHYGAEYERLATQPGGHKLAEKQLVERERRLHAIDLVPLTPSAVAAFTARWRQVQAAFVDDPSRALGNADRLVTEVMRERGYPVDDFEQRAADISVHHPHIVENYRAAHSIHASQGRRDDISTEQQREAFTHYRALFEELLETHDNDKPEEATA